MIRLILILALITPMTHAQQILATMVDRNRVILLFAPTGLDPHLREQLDLLEHHSEDLRSRDVVILPILLNPSPPSPSNLLRALHLPLISDNEQLIIRRRFHVAPFEFVVILLGKDGGQKLRSATPIPATRLNRTIDAMPTRQQELKGLQPRQKPSS